MILFVCSVYSVLFCINAYTVTEKADNETLILVHVLFRHGDRTPELSNLDPTNPYYNESYYEPGYGQLTKEGRVRSYNVGVSLRNRYNDFLGEEYKIKLVEGRSSDFNRTKDSLQLVLAGLFPPTAGQNWKEGMLWQPIPYNYLEREKDKELFCFGCPAWDKLFAEVQNSPGGRAMLEPYGRLFDYVNKQTEQHLDLLTIYYYYFGFEIQEQLGLKIPAWAEKIYPYPLLNITVTYYDFMFAHKDLKRMAGGYLMKKIISDTEHKINKTLTPQERKIFLYSGHENNIASVLELLNLREFIDVPPYGSQVIFEVHNINNTYGMKNEDCSQGTSNIEKTIITHPAIIAIKMNSYKNSAQTIATSQAKSSIEVQVLYCDSQSEPKTLKIPGFDNDFVPFDDFKSYLHEYTEMDDSICRGGAFHITPGKITILIITYLLIIY